jgi:DNA-binding PadR family transcriptional regulator
VKLSPAQRETLALLKLAGDAQTAKALGMPYKTMDILQRSGCVEVARIDGKASLSTGVYYRITDKGRQETCA